MKKWIVMCILAVLVIGMVLMGGCTLLNPYQVRVIYPGKWNGAMGTAGYSEFMSGTGTMTYDIPHPISMVMIHAAKMDDSSQRLTVEILKNGNIIKSDFTDAPRGTVACVYMI